MTQADTEFLISRTFDAPRDLVWRAFSEADRIARWWGPKGFTVQPKRFEFCPRGVFHFYMRSEQGNEMWGRLTYREISPKDRIVFVNSFSDETGEIRRGPFGPTLPMEILITVLLEAVGDKTAVTLTARAINATREGQATFTSMQQGLRSGFGNAFDQLEAFLDEAAS